MTFEFEYLSKIEFMYGKKYRVGIRDPKGAFDEKNNSRNSPAGVPLT
jgi:hypothetical protein